MDILRRLKPVAFNFNLQCCSWSSSVPGGRGGSKYPLRVLLGPLLKHWQVLQVSSKSPLALRVEAQSSCPPSVLFRHQHLLQSSKYPPQSSLAILADAQPSSCHATWDQQLHRRHRPTVINKDNNINNKAMATCGWGRYIQHNNNNNNSISNEHKSNNNGKHIKQQYP